MHLSPTVLSLTPTTTVLSHIIQAVQGVHSLDYDVCFPRVAKGSAKSPLGLGLQTNRWTKNSTVGYFLPPWYYDQSNSGKALGYWGGGCPRDYNEAVRDAVVAYLQQANTVFPKPNAEMVQRIGK